MEIRTILISELADFVKSNLYKKTKNCPITIHRAISQSKNPRADQNDPALIIAVEKENIVGYIGFLPDKINDSKVYWNSCWWVDEKYKTIAIPLLLKFIKEGDEKIILTDFTPHTKDIIERLNFFNTIKLEDGFRGYLKFNLSEILPKKNEKLKPFKVLFLLFDKIANTLFQPKVKPLKLIDKPILQFNESDHKFIEKHSQQELIQRNIIELEWILNSPWVKDSPQNYSHYNFTATAKNFNTKMVRLFDKEKLIAILYLRQLNQQLNIPFIYCENQYLDQAAQFIFNEAVKNQSISITTFNSGLKAIFAGAFKFAIQRNLKRDFAYHKSIQQIIKTPVILQDGDSDVAFC